MSAQSLPIQEPQPFYGAPSIPSQSYGSPQIVSGKWELSHLNWQFLIVVHSILDRTVIVLLISYIELLL